MKRMSLICAGWLLFSACGDLEAAVHSGKPGLRELRLAELPEESANGDLFSQGRGSHRQLLNLIRDMETQPEALGLFLRVDMLGGGWGRTADLITALERVRKASKPIHCHADAADNLSFVLMASACDRITMSPSGLLNLVGVAAQLIHARKLLDSIGLTAEMLHVGKYKGAADTLTEETITPAARETWDELLGVLDARITAAVGTRLKTQDMTAIRAVLDRGPLTAQEARALGLIDDVEYDDEARHHAKTAAKTEHVDRITLDEDPDDVGIAAIIEALSAGDRARAPRKPHLSVVTLTGTIVDGRGDGNPSAAADPFVRRMRRLGDDTNVAAVLLRIDSPGGSAPASDRMWHAVARVAKRKPVVVSIGDMAASGGYYIACAATTIFAQDESLVGSIGVVGGKIVAADLAERIGVNVTVMKRGQNAAWLSPVRKLEPSERDALQRMLDATYALFLDRVQVGRKMPMEKVRDMAEGRVMSGIRGREGGLVDQRGGLVEAMAEARRLGKLDDEAPIDVWPGDETFFERLSHVFGGDREVSVRQRLLAWLPREARAPVIESLLVNGDIAATVLPYALTLQ